MKKSLNFKHKLQFALRLGYALRLVWESGPAWMVASAVLLVVLSLVPALSLFLMKMIVDALTLCTRSRDPTAAFGGVALWIGAAGTLALVETVCRSLADLVREAQAQAVTDHIHGLLHAKSIELDLEYYENAEYYDRLHRAQQEAPYRPTRVVQGLQRIFQGGISLLAVSGLLASFHWETAAVLFITALPGILVRLRYSEQTFRWLRERTATERRAMYYDWMLIDGHHAKEIRLFDLGALFTSRFRALRNRLRRERLKLAARRSAAELAAQVGSVVITFGMYAFLAHRAAMGSISLGSLVMYFQGFQRGQGFLRDLLGGMSGLYEDNLFLSYFFDFLELRPKVVEPRNPKPVPHPFRGDIVFDRVRFRYPSGAKRCSTRSRSRSERANSSPW